MKQHNRMQYNAVHKFVRVLDNIGRKDVARKTDVFFKCYILKKKAKSRKKKDIVNAPKQLSMGHLELFWLCSILHAKV